MMPNQHAHHDAVRARTLARAVCAAMAIAMSLILCSACAYRARADESSPEPSASSSKNGISMTIASATPVVTANSGYHVTLVVSNNTDSPSAAGTVSAATNSFYTFDSRTDIQQWAQGAVRIPVPNQIGQASVASIPAHSQVDTSIDVPASQSALTSIMSWGPKPVLLSYSDGQNKTAESHTFLTRSADGLHTANTPAMNLTVAMPLMSDKWQADPQQINSLMTVGNIKEATNYADSIVSLNAENSRVGRTMEQLIAKHGMLQIIADPAYLNALQMPPKISGIMQPGGFDITQYAALSNSSAYAKAGVGEKDWDVSAATEQLRQALGNNDVSASAYAWQGKGNWTLQALTDAKRQGYSTVISDSTFDSQDSATVHTGKYVVPTSAGNVTVLVGQHELSELASGEQTSKYADGETSAAGRLSRFMAQSAFYQMEQPYTSRNLLVCLDSDTATAQTDGLMSAIEQASWLKLTDMQTLAKSEAYLSGPDTESLIAQSSGLRESQTSSLASALQSLASSRDDINRFAVSILDDASQGSSTGTPRNNVQSLAKQDVNGIAMNTRDATSWVQLIRHAHDALALHALDDNEAVRTRMLAAAKTLSAQLMDGITITPSESVNVVSETASFPVTVSNRHPFPVSIRVASITDSMEIVTSRLAYVQVPAHSEAQVTFTIRVATSGSTKAHVTLLDRSGETFSSPQTTTITSVLQISDKGGMIFLAVSVALGALGLWRQFHRKKDSDE